MRASREKTNLSDVHALQHNHFRLELQRDQQVDVVEDGVEQRQEHVSLLWLAVDEPALEDRSPFHDGSAHEDHAVARHGGGRGVVDVVHFEEDLGVGGHRDAVTVGQSQSLVVVQH